MVFSSKRIFKNEEGNFHIGLVAPDGFFESDSETLKDFLKDLRGKKIWRCHFCNDLTIIEFPLDVCPTCKQEFAYVEIDLEELKNFLEIR